MDFEENEVIRFQYAASFRGKEGKVFITSLRIFFLPNSGQVQESQSFTWANIKSVEYSPANDPQGRAAMRIGTVIDAKKQLMLLLNNDQATRFAALETIKGIVSDIRKPGSSSTANAPPPPTTATTSSVKVPSGTSASSSSSSSTTTITTQKKKEYNADFEARGRTNNFITNMVTKKADGNIVISLTPEEKILIFNRFPAVKKAFTAEVPLKMSEKTFWESFFKSQYFNRPQENDILNAERKFFTRYEVSQQQQQQDGQQQQQLTQQQQQQQQGVESVLGSKRRLKEVTEKDVDLTTSTEDFKYLPTTEAATEFSLGHWLNSNSNVIVAHDKQEVAAHMQQLLLLGGGKAGEEIDSLKYRPDEKYIPIKLRVEQQNQHGREDAFKGGDGHSLSANAEELFSLRTYQPEHVYNTLPNGQRARKIFDAEIQRAARHAHASQGYRHGELSIDSASHLDAHSKQEMIEIFSHVTELLRHFYACLRNAETVSASSSKASGIIQKLQEIAQNLETKKSHLSRSKGDAMSLHGDGSTHVTVSDQAREQAIPIWMGILGMIQRARINWETISGTR